MEDFFSHGWADLIGRIDGPMKLRLLVQPLLACILAVRAGLRDARENSPPFFWALAFGFGQRRDLLRQGSKDVGTVFVVAVILDLVYQAAVLRAFRPGQAMIVGIVLALVPYLLVRAPVTRVVETMKKQS